VPRSERVLAPLESHKNVMSLIVGRGPFGSGPRPFVWAAKEYWPDQTFLEATSTLISMPLPNPKIPSTCAAQD
jgi:hypothetical protein